jgi:MFS family permease
MSVARARREKSASPSVGSALSFVVLLGIVSLFADMTYEGARSLNGQFLGFLGASAAAVGVAAGAGEFLGYALRFLFGYLSDKTGQYWFMTVAGYVINLCAVPLLALAGRWEIAVGLIFAERIGKAVRNPARDALLSHATTQLGPGRAFGLAEALDQIGAVLGPLAVAGVLILRGNGQAADLGTYHTGYAVLLIPALVALGVLTLARMRFPQPRELESKSPRIGTRGYSRSYWYFLGGAGLVAAGFADFPLIAYHLQRASVAPIQWIPVAYSLAMGVDALTAVVAGRLYDRLGLPALIGVFAGAAFFAPQAFLGNLGLALVGVALWGVGMGAQESIMKASVANLAPADRRGTAFGLFHTSFGIFWLLGSALMGLLYDQALLYLVAFSVLVQLAAIPWFVLAARHRPIGGGRAA